MIFKKLKAISHRKEEKGQMKNLMIMGK